MGLVSIPYLFCFTRVIQRKENVCIFADAVVGKALQIDEEVVRHGDPTAIAMTLSHAVTLIIKKNMSANKSSPNHK